jgi:hypothetical protein
LKFGNEKFVSKELEIDKIRQGHRNLMKLMSIGLVKEQSKGRRRGVFVDHALSVGLGEGSVKGEGEER